MTDAYSWTGKNRRLKRLWNPASGTTFLVAAMSDNGVDGLIVHKGRVRFLPFEPLQGAGARGAPFPKRP
jgi:2-amino-4,5-dihydroxy-6-oxo-7-(phosphooxy)heptanoate synthase